MTNLLLLLLLAQMPTKHEVLMDLDVEEQTKLIYRQGCPGYESGYRDRTWHPRSSLQKLLDAGFQWAQGCEPKGE